MRNLLFGLIAVLVANDFAIGGEVKKFVIKCKNPQAVKTDEIYVEFYDGAKKIDFPDNAQKGTHKKNIYKMTENSELVLNEDTLKAIKFMNDLKVIVYEHDANDDETLGSKTFAANYNGTHTIDGTSGTKYEYSLEVETGP